MVNRGVMVVTGGGRGIGPRPIAGHQAFALVTDFADFADLVVGVSLKPEAPAVRGEAEEDWAKQGR